MNTWDAIVVGAGHNGLATATLLGAAGRRVVVLERQEQLGGLAATEEFHPGYRMPGILHDTVGVRHAAVKALGLERHGLRLRLERPDVLALGGGGRTLLLAGERAAAAREIGKASPVDGQRFLEWMAFLDRVRPVLDRLLDALPLDLVRLERLPLLRLAREGLALRRLGRRDLLEFLRIPPMCVADWLDEWFETDLLKAGLALPAVAGTWTGPWSPGTAANLLLREGAGRGGVEGGPRALVDALVAAARAASVEVRARARVQRIEVEAGRVVGVTLDDGTTLRAPLVAAACDPRQALLDLLPSGTLSIGSEEALRCFRSRGTTAHVALALDRAPSFAGAPDAPVEFARTGDRLDALERAFDPVKYRNFAERPVLEIHLASVADPALAPTGHAVLGALIHFAPHGLDGGWTDARREALGDRVLAVLEEHAPGITASVVARRVLSPADLERDRGLTGGHVHHGEHALDQLLVRPAPDCIGYSTPVAGLWLCGSGSWPGGGLTCAPGTLAGAAILRR